MPLKFTPEVFSGVEVFSQGSVFMELASSGNKLGPTGSGEGKF